MNTFAFIASSSPPLTEIAATAFVGVSSINLLMFDSSAFDNAISRSSDETFSPIRTDSAFTLGSFEFVSCNSCKILRAPCHLPVSIRHNAAAILALAFIGFRFTKSKDISKAISDLLCILRIAIRESLATSDNLSLCNVFSLGSASQVSTICIKS